jgi:hypothetical protein
MNRGEDQTSVHFERLCVLWSNPVPGYLEYHGKREEELTSWAEACDRKSQYATGRVSGDGFWEARVQWYKERAKYLRQYVETPSYVTRDKTGVKRKTFAIRPMDPYAKRRAVESGESSSEITHSVDPLPTSPTPSGSPSGEKEDSTSTPTSPSLSQSALGLIGSEYKDL